MATAQPNTTEEVVEEPAKPLKYKTWVLKVSLHCEGCKKKVKKILNAIEGVYTVDVDKKLHKATVTGNVDSKILIRKLEKSGKHAELWPEKIEQRESKQSKKKKGKQNDQVNPESNDKNNHAPTEDETPESAKVEVENSPTTGGKVEQESPPAGENPKPVEKKPPDSVGAAEKAAGNGGGGNGGKNKKKKGQKGNHGNGNEGAPPSGGNNGNNNCTGGGAQTQSNPGGQVVKPASSSPTGNCRVSEHPPSYNAPQPQQPVCTVSYNTAYPSNSYTASYYASPPSYSYTCVHQGLHSAEGRHSPLDWDVDYASQPSDTFEMFSEENPNACTVM